MKGVNYKKTLVPTSHGICEVHGSFGWKKIYMDATIAFLYCDLLKMFDLNNLKCMWCQLKMTNLHGLKQAPRVWYPTVNNAHFSSHDFTKNLAMLAFYVFKQGNEIVLVS